MTARIPWRTPCNRARVAFEFIEKLGAPFYAFHDRDVAPEGAAASPSRNKNLDAIVKVLKEEQQRTGIKLLWGTASLFVHPRYMHGAATSPNADVFAFAAAQVKKAWKSRTSSAARATPSGAAAKATRPSGTPT